ncbi:MAG: PAS domain S-box protein [Candidatus Krumholzibacteriia bacterium]
MAPALLLFGLAITLVALTTLFVVQMRRQVQAAWSETGRIYQRSTARFSAVGDLLEHVLFETDLSRTLIYTNRAFHDLTGFRQRDLQSGLTLTDVLGISADTDLAGLQQPGQVLVRRSDMCCRDGARVPVAVRLSPILEHDRLAGWRGLLAPLGDAEPVPSISVERVLGDILKDVNACSVAELPQALARGLAVIGRHLRADRCYHYAVSGDGSSLCSFSQWYAPGVSPMSGDRTLPGLDTYGWTLERLRHDGALVLADIGDLDRREVPERERWRRQGITSLLVVPLRQGDAIVGIVGCETLGRVHRWTLRDRQLLEAMSQICERVQNQERAAARLADATHRAGSLAELLPEPLAVADRDGAVVAWNAALATLTGLAADEVDGRPLVDVFAAILPAAGSWLQTRLECSGGEPPQPASSDYFQLGDAWLQLSLRPLEQHECLVHVCDVTAAERMRDRNATLERTMAAREQQLAATEARLLAAEQDAAVAREVGGLARQLDAPVAAALAAAGRLREHAVELGRAYADGVMSRAQFEAFLAAGDEASAAAMESLSRAARLVSGIRGALGEPHPRSRRPVGLRSCLEDVIASLAPRLRERHVEVRIACPDALTLEADPATFTQLVADVVLSTLQHAFDGMLVGTITIEAEAAGEQVRLEIRDDGCGRPATEVSGETGPDAVGDLVAREFGGWIERRRRAGRGASLVIVLPHGVEARDPVAG